MLAYLGLMVHLASEERLNQSMTNILFRTTFMLILEIMSTYRLQKGRGKHILKKRSDYKINNFTSRAHASLRVA